jgi:hypothetical protein
MLFQRFSWTVSSAMSHFPSSRERFAHEHQGPHVRLRAVAPRVAKVRTHQTRYARPTQISIVPARQKRFPPTQQTEPREHDPPTSAPTPGSPSARLAFHPFLFLSTASRESHLEPLTSQRHLLITGLGLGLGMMCHCMATCLPCFPRSHLQQLKSPSLEQPFFKPPVGARVLRSTSTSVPPASQNDQTLDRCVPGPLFPCFHHF